MTQLPATETDTPQERAAEASEDVDSKWFSEEALQSRQPSKYGKKVSSVL